MYQCKPMPLPLSRRQSGCGKGKSYSPYVRTKGSCYISLTRCQLDGAAFGEAEDAEFTNCTMRDLQHKGGKLGGVDMQKCDFHSAQCEGLVLEGMADDCRFDWEGATVSFQDVDLFACEFTERAWGSLHMEGCTWADCRVGGVEIEDEE